MNYSWKKEKDTLIISEVGSGFVSGNIYKKLYCGLIDDKDLPEMADKLCKSIEELERKEDIVLDAKNERENARSEVDDLLSNFRTLARAYA